jgi:hypothetical protein
MNSTGGVRQINRSQALYFVAGVFYAAALFFFYVKYVPLIQVFPGCLASRAGYSFRPDGHSSSTGNFIFHFFLSLNQQPALLFWHIRAHPSRADGFGLVLILFFGMACQ